MQLDSGASLPHFLNFYALVFSDYSRKIRSMDTASLAFHDGCPGTECDREKRNVLHSPMNGSITVWAQEHVQLGGSLLVGGRTPCIQTQLGRRVAVTRRRSVCLPTTSLIPRLLPMPALFGMGRSLGTRLPLTASVYLCIYL